MISQEHGEYLLNIAKKAVKTYLETGEQILVPEDCPEELKEKLGVFVTWGCDTKSHFFLILIVLFFFNFIYYEVQSFIIDINICGCFIHGFKRW